LSEDTILQITVLAENTSISPNVKSQHGLSLYIKTDNHNILFDTGSSGLFARNAVVLGCDLTKIDTAVISHGHRDHGGGLSKFLHINNTAKVYMRKSAFDKHFISVLGLKFSVSLNNADINNRQIVFVDDELKIDNSLTLFTTVDSRVLLSTSNEKLFKSAGSQIVRDDFGHEQYLLITENGVKTLISGCSHKGIYNIISAAQKRFGKIDNVIGGMHLYNPPTYRYENDELILSIAEKLKGTETKIFTCHCTGKKAFEKMKTVLGESIKEIKTGMTFSV
jgi:7,8-dihydropterin-6-yl-methyl-4-(beta-D-ribofuranosyl)aminobenzene 5'-phosphate synthase